MWSVMARTLCARARQWFSVTAQAQRRDVGGAFRFQACDRRTGHPAVRPETRDTWIYKTTARSNWCGSG